MEVLTRLKKSNEIKTSEQILFNDQYFVALLKDINQAKKSINLTTYIYTYDNIGKKITAALLDAVKRQVKVRVLVDGVGSRYLEQSTIAWMKANGIAIKIFHPLPFRFWQFKYAAHVPSKNVFKLFFYLIAQINYRNHRKLCLIDDRIVYISSANIDDSHVRKSAGGKGWRDNTVRIIYPYRSILKDSFFRTWNYIPKYQMLAEDKAKLTPSIFNVNYTWRQRRTIYKNLLSKISCCKKRVWITNAYFIPDSFILKALIRAAKRNVDVCILLPKISDIMVSTLVANTFYLTLIKNNIAVYEYIPSMLHAKTMILDDFYLMGSSNLNTRSLKHDLEIDVIIQDENSKHLLQAKFIEDIQLSQKVSLDDLKKESIFKYVLGRVLLYFRYWF